MMRSTIWRGQILHFSSDDSSEIVDETEETAEVAGLQANPDSYSSGVVFVVLGQNKVHHRLDHHAQVHFGPGNNQDHRLEGPTCRRDAQLLTGRMVMPQRSQKESTQINSNLRFDDELTQRAPATDDGCSSPDLVGRVG